MEPSIYKAPGPFELETGYTLPELKIAYHTYGKPNAAYDNVVWVCHALTANSDVADWWPHTVEAGRFLDPARHFVVCANILGSHYGTTGPLHVNPETGSPYYKDFPPFTIRDIVRAHRLLAGALGIGRIDTLVGSSVGGFQAIEWAVLEPERIGKLILIATAAKASPWTIAIDQTQRMAIEADTTFGEPRDDAGMAGLAAARALGLLTYRGSLGYNLTQQDKEELPAVHRASTYQQYQGEKLCRRYNAYSVVWVCHALTANSDVADWWPHTVEAGRFLDPARHFVVCANILGSHYGTTGPLHVNPETGSPYYKDFPPFTIRDIVRAHRLLAGALGIGRIDTLVGSSVGGFQAIEWAVLEPERIGKLILIATAAKASPWTIAIDQTQRMAIEADTTFGEPRDDAGMAGLAAARALGLLTYRGSLGYNLTQQDKEELPAVHRASTYQQYQGEKLCRRYNAYSYYAILNAFDTHDTGRGRGGVAAALARIEARTAVVGITTDIIFTPAATAAKASPWTIAIDQTQRMAIEADTTFGEPRDDAGMAGLAAARALGLLTYRGSLGYNLTQQDKEELPAVHRASTYQQYQGEKLCRRYNAYSYYAILNAFDTHDTGRGRGGVAAALARIEARTAVVGITTDIIFTPAEMRELHGMIAGSTYHEIDSPFGHDGFLVEHGQLNDILYPFMNNQ
ncbi:alpha/beta fold hydrolase [Alistipes onderdonkii]|nr:alpha/beta fold hydrolase [Alistipes onderdonkii]